MASKKYSVTSLAVSGICALAGALISFYTWSRNNPLIVTNNITCTICRDKITSDKIDLPCKHSFHKCCLNLLEKQGQRNCPDCFQTY